jgi:hypothetical protein
MRTIIASADFWIRFTICNANALIIVTVVKLILAALSWQNRPLFRGDETVGAGRSD